MTGGRAGGMGHSAPEKPAVVAPGDASLSSATAELHKTAKQLEDKVGRRRSATAEARATLAEFNDALNAVKQTAERLISS